MIIGLAGSLTLSIQYPLKLSVVYICCLEALCLVSTNLRVKYLPPECTAVFPVKLCLCRLFAAERSLHVFTLSFQWTETHFPVWQLSPYSFSHCYCFLKKNLLCLQKQLTVWSLTESFRTAAEWNLYSNETQIKVGKNMVIFCRVSQPSAWEHLEYINAHKHSDF